jgi:hypothetical protein
MDPEFLDLAISTRKNSRTSRYNSKVEVRKCEVCKSIKDLETHHIQHQATAVKGFVEQGVHIHRESNLTVLCSCCHDKYHAGSLIIEGWIETTMGRLLKWSEPLQQNRKPKPIEMELDFNTIKDRLRICLSKSLKEKDIINMLEKETGTKITISNIRKWKKRLLQ